jgi:hypothetical protein
LESDSGTRDGGEGNVEISSTSISWIEGADSVTLRTIWRPVGPLDGSVAQADKQLAPRRTGRNFLKPQAIREFGKKVIGSWRQ